MARTGRLRIIGGRWRGRRIPFAAFAGVRPTTDRIRETVFNWLQGYIEGSRCLDLFAGSGAFGFEALSRGAASVVMVEQDLRVVQTLQGCAELLVAGTETGMNSGQLEVVWRDAGDFLGRRGVPPFDIAFLDPPYRDASISRWAERLAGSGLLARAAWIYLEAPGHLTPELPPTWTLVRSKRSGQVGYHLARTD